MKINRYAKAIVGAIVAGAAAWGTAVADGSITAVEYSGIVVAVVTALGLIWAVPNTEEASDGS